MPRTLLVYIALLINFTLLSCHPKTVPAVNSCNEAAAEKILFLAYEVTRDSSSGKITTKILYQKTADGMVKAGSIDNAGNGPGNWQITITDHNDKTIETLWIENPLHKKLEYAGDDGRLGMKDVWLTRAEVAVRINYKKSMDKVLLQEIGANKNNRTIFTHSILLTTQ